MANSRNKAVWRFLDGPICLAAVLCFGYYALLSTEAMKGSLLHKYTTEHVTEYVIVAVLAWGISDLLLRCLGFRPEMRALKQAWFPQREGQEPAVRASEFNAHLQTLPRWMQDSRLGRRLQQAVVYVHEKQSADGFDDHLRDLSERDAGQTHANYAVPKFVVWITPVLGFLGTVVHFGMALGSLSPDDLAKNLPIVVAGMGTAFDTTTMALSSSVSIMLGMFLVERTEQGIVRDIDALVDRELSNRFAVDDANVAPFLRVVESSSRSTLAAMQESSTGQIQVWRDMLTTLQQQQDEWQRSQREAWTSMFNLQLQRDDNNDARREERMRKFLEGFAVDRTQHQAKMQQTVEQFSGLQKNLGQMTESLARVLAGEGQLLSLQKSLADNLRILQQTQQFDQAVNGLTAAIHLLTVRQQSPSHASPRAA